MSADHKSLKEMAIQYAVYLHPDVCLSYAEAHGVFVNAIGPKHIKFFATQIQRACDAIAYKWVERAERHELLDVNSLPMPSPLAYINKRDLYWEAINHTEGYGTDLEDAKRDALISLCRHIPKKNKAVL